MSLPAVQPDPSLVQAQSPAAATVTANAGQGAPSAADQQADLRLVIEDDKAAGSYVYKLVDSVTGKVVSQVPREEVLRMREASSYQPGAVVSART
ncbi:MAG: flagellar protein FlaG [Caulobacterales bacterium]